MLKNKIPTESMLVENLIVAYYAKTLNHNIAIWVKRSKKSMLLEYFEEAVLVEKDILSLKDNVNVEAESTSSSKNKIEILTRPSPNKKEQETLDLESLHKYF
jgi:antitoxin component YwqK of YwqJK toxin-antitoxin module